MVMKEQKIVTFGDVENAIIKLRNRQVILDSDMATLYGVETMRVNETVKNNPDKSPDGYIFTLTKAEKAKVAEKFDNLDRDNVGKVKFSPKLPKAFTERGVYMPATVLKSEQATQTTIAIVDTFAHIRELSRTISELSNSPEKDRQKELMQKSGEIISDILDEELKTSESETSIERNFAVLKFRHTIKRKTDN